jgi:hypothetical protein
MAQEFVIRNGLKILEVTSGSTSDQLLVYNTSTGVIESKTDVATDPFPYTGDAEIIGSLTVTANTGNVEFSYPQALGAWSVGGALINGTFGQGGAGTQNAAISFAGYCYPFGGITFDSEEYNGTTWSVGGTLSDARYYLAGAGTQNAALAFGGYNPGFVA